MKTLLLSALMIVHLAGCGTDQYGAAPKDYDNDLTEEAYRFLFDQFPHSSEEIAYCIVWGYKFAPIPDRFVARFADMQRDVVSYADVDTQVVGTNLIFRLSSEARAASLPAAMFQVVLLPPGDDGMKRIEMAWTYRNQSRRMVVAMDEGRPDMTKFSVIRDLVPVAAGTSQRSGEGSDL